MSPDEPYESMQGSFLRSHDFLRAEGLNAEPFEVGATVVGIDGPSGSWALCGMATIRH